MKMNGKAACMMVYAGRFSEDSEFFVNSNGVMISVAFTQNTGHQSNGTCLD